MVHLGPDPTEDDMLGFAEKWIDLVAEGNFEAAFQSTAHDPYYQWTPELIRRVIEGYGLPEPHPCGDIFHVTPRSTARGGPPTRRVETYGETESRFLEILYDLPLNGEWSDLTVTFRVDPCPGGSRVTLQEIHVF